MKVVVTGGGTGGHLFPGIAVAEEFINAYPESEVMFIGTERQMDMKVLSGKPFKKEAIKSSGLKGKSLGAVIQALVQLPMSIHAAARILREFKPSLVLGVGGYVSGPVVLAARLLGIATCIHEQNSIPGLANRMLGRIVHKIFLSMPGSEGFFPPEKTIITGNPVRKELIERAGMPKRTERGSATLLVLGGSQGARRVNRLVVDSIRIITDKLPGNFRMIHQTGAQDEGWVKNEYDSMGVHAEVSAFITDMAKVYDDCDLLISRAGATTLAEITVMAKPSILIPYPFSADGHQDINARFLADAGAAKLFYEKELTGEELGKEIIGLLSQPAVLMEMAEKAGNLAKPDAARRIISASMDLLMSLGKCPAV
ncbi:MAG: undecaprenyldiphospho-muramoylpentapeptide beta-N-acetylglucosaminyltransferase [Proteobacteria bacterium]|nr:undecaprenyldiphospho-muramoylpentapeptide beta-N-acetylglucosaminyltransferase [Pseudomonadota bacterium]MBU1708377.1 undecaprenyldiphospho-muramoylpentapeptide beta-N-acetylglucosaminyltransferase [Pseudomonadota bacterium]